MNKLYNNLKSKIEKLQSADSSVLRINFFKALLVILRHVIILTMGAGNSFPLIFQAQGRQIVEQSYKDFKSYQKKIRIIFLLVIILILVVIKIY